MRAPRGLTTKMVCQKDGRVYFNITATKFYLFKMILKIGGQNMHHPATAFLIFAFALYYLLK